MENEILKQRVDAGLLRPEWAGILAKAKNDELVTFCNLCTAAEMNDKASRTALAVAFPGCGGAHALGDYNEIDSACSDLLPENTVSAMADKALQQLKNTAHIATCKDEQIQAIAERQRSPLEVARVSAGYSIRQLAKLADVAPNTIANIEKGYNVPKVDILRTLADVLGVSLDTLWPKK